MRIKDEVPTLRKGGEKAMTSCGCPKTEVIVVLRLPVACIHKRAKVKRQEIRDACSAGHICDECRAQMVAQDDGWQIDLENSPACACN